MKVTRSPLPEVLIVEPAVHRDGRGYFWETFQMARYAEVGLDALFVQDNHSRSAKNVVRALHAQRFQGKLVTVIRGLIYDVAVDIRPDSPTFRRWYGTELSEEDHRQVYVPPGFAHGFCVLSEEADIIYKATDYYRPQEELGILWDDPALGIEWPVSDPVLSERDRQNPPLQDVPVGELLTCRELAARTGRRP